MITLSVDNTTAIDEIKATIQEREGSIWLISHLIHLDRLS
jgi:hypothetical protein